MNLHENKLSIPQQEINSAYLPGINPYVVEKTASKPLILKKIPTGTEEINHHQLIQTTGILILILGLIGYVIYQIKRKQESKTAHKKKENFKKEDNCPFREIQNPQGEN
jgi:preprotein translocase subunit Sss1